MGVVVMYASASADGYSAAPRDDLSVPVFVATHQDLEPVERNGALFTFASGAPSDLLAPAREAAGDRDVVVELTPTRLAAGDEVSLLSFAVGRRLTDGAA